MQIPLSHLREFLSDGFHCYYKLGEIYFKDYYYFKFELLLQISAIIKNLCATAFTNLPGNQRIDNVTTTANDNENDKFSS